MRTVYIETTVVSYLVARPSRDIVIAARQELTREWWDGGRQACRLVVSPVVLDEAHEGDPAVAARRAELLAGMEVLPVSSDVDPLAVDIGRVIRLPASKAADAFHLAYAIVYKVDCLLTWNCAHFVNALTRRRLYDYCRQNDLWLPVVCTPEEMIGGKWRLS
jgi:predicted nucleic acid-binding protein